METDSGLFDIEVYCNLCGSDNVEMSYDTNNKCLMFECECGVEDRLYIEEL